MRTFLSPLLVVALSPCLPFSFSPHLPFSRSLSAGEKLPTQALHRFGTSRFCTQAVVASLVLSKDGKLLAAADADGRVYLWEIESGKQLIRTAAASGKRVALSPDGQWLALGEDAPFEVRNLRKQLAPRLPIGNGPRAFAFSPDSKAIAIAAGDEDAVTLYDLAANKELRPLARLDDKLEISTLTFSPDGRFVAAAGKPMVDMDKPFGRIALWDAQKGKLLKHIDVAGSDLRNLVILSDNRTLLGQVGARLVGFTLPALERIAKITHEVGSSFAIDQAATTLASSDGPRVRSLDGKELHDFDNATLLRHVALSGDGKLLAASAARLESGTPRILLWDLAAGKERVRAEAHRHYVDAVEFAHDGKKIATASHVEGAARVWDAGSAKLLHTLNLDSFAAKKSGGPRARRSLVDALAFGAERPELFVAGQRWDLDKGEPIPAKGNEDFQFEQANSTRAILMPSGRLAASFLHDNTIQFWDPAAAKEIGRVKPDAVRGDWHAIAFTPDGKLAANGRWFAPIRKDADEGPRDTIILWDVKASKRVKSFRPSPVPIVRLHFSHDGETLAVIGFPNRLELWHLATAKLLREMYLSEIDDTMPRELVLPPVAFAPHGQWIAFSHLDGEIVLIETATGKEILTLHGHRGPISSLAFAPDSRRLLSGGRDTTALLWSVSPASPAAPASWKDADSLWAELGGQTEPAYRAAWALMAHPDRAIDVIVKRLLPDSGAPDKEIKELIANLSSPKFPRRDAAMSRLKEIGVRALPALEQAVKNAPDLETGRRIDELLKTVQTALTPDSLRDQRSLVILEMINTPAARQLLTAIARGDPAAPKTRLARAALDRANLSLKR